MDLVISDPRRPVDVVKPGENETNKFVVDEAGTEVCFEDQYGGIMNAEDLQAFYETATESGYIVAGSEGSTRTYYGIAAAAAEGTYIATDVLYKHVCFDDAETVTGCTIFVYEYTGNVSGDSPSTELETSGSPVGSGVPLGSDGSGTLCTTSGVTLSYVFVPSNVSGITVTWDSTNSKYVFTGTVTGSVTEYENDILGNENYDTFTLSLTSSNTSTTVTSSNSGEVTSDANQDGYSTYTATVTFEGVSVTSTTNGKSDTVSGTITGSYVSSDSSAKVAAGFTSDLAWTVVFGE